MNGIEQLVLGFGVLVFAVTVVLLLQRKGVGGGRLNLSLASIFEVEVEVNSKAAAKEAAHKAAAERGTLDVARVDREIEQSGRVRLARILWVDDHPDNNLFETIALEELGLLVTKATSTEAGLAYLGSNLEFSMLITDVGRNGDTSAGPKLIEKARTMGFDAPVIVYTADAARHSHLATSGAQAVVDTPVDLIAEVLESRP